MRVLESPRKQWINRVTVVGSIEIVQVIDFFISRTENSKLLIRRFQRRNVLTTDTYH